MDKTAFYNMTHARQHKPCPLSVHISVRIRNHYIYSLTSGIARHTHTYTNINGLSRLRKDITFTLDTRGYIHMGVLYRL